MTRTDLDHVSRRRLLSALGVVAGVGLVSGCLADRDADPTSNETDTESNPEDDTDANEEENKTPDEESSDSDSGADDSGTNESNEQDETDSWGVDEFVFDARSSGFTGVEPAVIADEENPTLVLTEGEEYTLTWRNADGHAHNIEVWNDDETVVGDYATEPMDVEGDSQSLTIEASPAMAEYVCAIHASWGKRGDLEIRAPDQS
ncbi:cupredoxin domain-containing protein [Natronosalvus vescus]|uniref:cupredoxin domain-containing protein n=1 Tax=Natronosalvus vescus TaxID=2953881 RepID=UPI00209095EE|nr:plastocyanin [Natronosalvus vescus]